jgi:ribA/ribD-fused uncharacterized protein
MDVGPELYIGEGWQMLEGAPDADTSDSATLFDPSVPPIDSFSGDYLGLSNLIPFPIEIEGIRFPTLEHAFQAMKSPRSYDWIEIAKLANAGDARRRGDETRPRDNWEAGKRLVMYKLLQKKFQTEPYKTMLVETWPRQLIETNHWKDRYWGVYRGKGQNWLGRLLMRVRLELLAEQVVKV